MTTSSALARHRLCLLLRQARQKVGLSQEALAGRLEWSTAKVMRIENGQVRVSTTDLRAVLAECNVDDTAIVEAAVVLARVGRYETWRHYGSALSEDFAKFLELEQAASSIRQFEVKFVPALLQTVHYARAVSEARATRGAAEERPEDYVEVWRARQSLLAAAHPPDAHFIIDEAALRGVVGSPALMRAQLHRLREIASRSGAQIQVLPISAGLTMGLLGSFTILDFGDFDDALVYVENQRGDSVALPEGHPDVEQKITGFRQLSLLASAPRDLPVVLDELLA